MNKVNKAKKRLNFDQPNETSYEVCVYKLKSLERIAYSGIVQAFRAQGSLTEEKKKLLKEMQIALHISTASYKHELQMAVNSERLRIIAEKIEGPDTSREWMLEGKSLCPPLSKMPRRTEYSDLADEIVRQYQKLDITSGVTPSIYVDEQEETEFKKEMEQHFVSSDASISNANVNEVELTLSHLLKSELSQEPLTTEESTKDAQKRKSTNTHNEVPSKVIVIDPLSVGFNKFIENNEQIVKQPSSSDTPLQSTPPITQDNEMHFDSNPAAVESTCTAGKATSITVQETFTAVQEISKIAQETSAIMQEISTTMQEASTTVQTTSMTMQTVPTTVQTSTVQKATKIPMFNTTERESLSISTITPVTCIMLKPAVPCIPAYTAFSPLFQMQNTTSSTSSSNSASVVNSLKTPLLSVTESFPACKSIPVTDTELKTKQTLSAKKCVQSKMFKTESTVTSSSSHQSSSNSTSPLQKTILTLKARSTSVSTNATSSPISVTSVSTTFKRPVSPITLIQRGGISTNSSKLKCPLPLKYCQAKMPLESSTKVSVSSSNVSKASVITSLGTRTAPSSTPQSNVSESPLSGVLKTKTSVLPPGKINTVNTGHKVVSSIMPKSSSIQRNTQFGSEGGLKIVSQNVPRNPVLPKLTLSSAGKITVTATTTLATITSTSGLTKTTKIVSLPHPIKIDRGRLNLFRPSSLSASNSISATNIHVSSPGAIVTPGGRQTLVMKPEPNIVVVKAQSYSHSSGAAILVPSTSTLTRLTDKVIVGEAITLIERKIPARYSSTLPERIKVPSNQQTLPNTSAGSPNSANAARPPWILPKMKDPIVPIKAKLELKKPLDSAAEHITLNIPKEVKSIKQQTPETKTVPHNISVEKFKTSTDNDPQSVKKSFIKPVMW